MMEEKKMTEKQPNIKMTRVLVHNWAGFEKEIVNIGEVTQIIGANGSGKSTLIDALNLVWSGTKRLNEAASGNRFGNTRERTVTTAIHSVDLTSNKVRRSGQVTAYIIIEFYNQVNKSYFLNGIQLYSKKYEEKDTSVTEIYFSFANAKLEEMLDFVFDPTNTRLNTFAMSHRTRFITYASKDKAFQNFYHQRGINELKRNDFEKKVNRILAVRMVGNDGRKIAIDEFAKEYILPSAASDGSGDINSFREQNETLTTLKEDLKQKNEKGNILEDIDKNAKKCEEYEIKKTYLENTRTILEIDKNEAIITKSESDKLNAENEKDCVDREISDLEENIKQEKKNIEAIKDEMNSSVRAAEKEHEEAVKKVNVLELEKKTYDNVSDAVKSLEKYDICLDEEMSDESLSRLNENLDKSIDKDDDDIQDLKGLLHDKKETFDSLKEQEDNLKKGVVVSGNKAASELKNAFNNKYRKDAHLLYEMIDSIDQEWQQSIENFLGNRRFALLVEDAYVTGALKLYKDYKGSIVARIKDSSSAEKKNAFNAIKVKDNDVLATRYLKGLLQRVVLCDTEDELKAAVVGIMKDGRSSSSTMYENRSVKDLILVCGKEAIKRELARVQKDKEIIESEIKELNNKLSTKNKMIFEKRAVKRILSCSKINYNVYSELEEAKREETELLKKVNTIKSGTRNTELRKELDIRNGKLVGYEKNKENLILKKGVLIDKIDAATELIKNKTNENKSLKRKFETTGINENDIREYIVENGITVDNLDEKYKEDFGHNGNYETYQKNVSKAVSKYQKLDPRFDFKVNESEIKRIEKMIKEIREVKYLEIAAAIDEHTKKMREYKKNFFTSIGENYKKAVESVKRLNQSLGKTRFGGERITIELGAAENEFGRYLKAIKISCLNESSTEEEKKWAEEVLDSMVDKIIEKNSDACQKLGDYKNFLKVRVYLEHENLESGSKTKLSLQKYNGAASGGQEQTPLYMLLAISMVSVFTETGVRMIILDEAFSKMDKERTEYVINFFKELNLQVIISTYEQLNSKNVDMTNLIQKSKNGTGMKSFMARYDEELGKWVKADEKYKGVKHEEDIVQAA